MEFDAGFGGRDLMCLLLGGFCPEYHLLEREGESDGLAIDCDIYYKKDTFLLVPASEPQKSIPLPTISTNSIQRHRYVSSTISRNYNFISTSS